MNKELSKSIDSFICENYDRIFRDIARLVSVNSIEGEPQPDAPFGTEVKKVQRIAFDICRELGLETYNCENYIGYAKIGSSKKYLATITHLDIVPTGDGWSHDPFTVRERENYIIGRGVMDDKGPSVLCLYALKYLKEHNIPLKYEIRALLGLNEETGMGDVEYYLKNYEPPVFCFSPDADFPLINGEKGITQGRIVSKSTAEKIVNIKGGFAVNAVPDKCEAWVKTDLCANSDNIIAVMEDGVCHITSTGIGGHASMPDGTKNAIGIMAHYLLNNDLLSPSEREYFRFVCKLYDDPTGKLLGVDADDGLFKPLTIVGGVIRMEDGHFVQTYDSRYPTNTSGVNIAGKIGKQNENILAAMDKDVAPFYMSLDNPAVQVCVNAYNDVTGENAQPFTIGGGTYARDFPNAVSFGPEHPERPAPKWAGSIHGVDEAACKDYLVEALKVYITALIELEKLEF